jgi:hypothetical protein
MPDMQFLLSASELRTGAKEISVRQRTRPTWKSKSGGRSRSDMT